MRLIPAKSNSDKIFKAVPIAFLCALMTTIALLSLIQLLVAGSNDTADQSTPFHFVDFIGSAPQKDTMEKKLKPQKPKREQQPSRKIINKMTTSQLDLSGKQPSFIALMDEMKLSTQSMSLIKSEGDMLPIVKVTPVYPPRALNRGIEGNCVIEFTVMADGSVDDASVVTDQCDALFSGVSLQAVKKFKYKPRIENGIPITVAGIRNKFVYRLEQ